MTDTHDGNRNLADSRDNAVAEVQKWKAEAERLKYMKEKYASVLNENLEVHKENYKLTELARELAEALHPLGELAEHNYQPGSNAPMLVELTDKDLKAIKAALTEARKAGIPIPPA